MNQKVKTFVGLAAFAVLIISAVFAYNALQGDNAPDILVINDAQDTPTEQVSSSQAENEPQTELEQVPNFTMLDADGNELQLHDFLGKPIVLNFWTTWCPACVRESPYFESLYQEHSEAVHVIKVNLLDGQRETRAAVDDFMYTNGYTFPLYFDVNGAARYGVRGIPVTFFICERGYPIASAQGPINENTLWQGLEAIGVSR